MDSKVIDEEIVSLEARLIELRTQAEITQLQSEIRVLEQQCSAASPFHSSRLGSARPRDFSFDLEASPKTLTPRQMHEEPAPTVHKRVSVQQTGVKVKPATYDGLSSWKYYKAHFEACSKINAWNDEEKGLYLAVSLRGQAQGILSNLSQDRDDYDTLMKALEERFEPPNQAELYRAQLRERRQQASETLSEMAQDIRRLTNLAYPSAPSDVRDVLAKEQFIDSLVSSDMRLRVKQARPVDLNDAVRHALELEAFNRAERTLYGGTACIQSVETQASVFTDLVAEIKGLKDAVSEIKDGLEGMKNQRQAFQYQRKSCFRCGSKAHLIRNCPQKEKFECKDASQKNCNGRSSPGASGLFVKANVGNTQFDCLVDTGATLTTIALRVWNRLGETSVSSFSQEVVSASGTSINVFGKASVQLEIEGLKYQIPVIIADIEVDGILGLDFMRSQNVVLDMANKKMTINGNTCSLQTAGKIGCFRVVTSGHSVVGAKSPEMDRTKIVQRTCGKSIVIKQRPNISQAHPKEGVQKNTKEMSKKKCCDMKVDCGRRDTTRDMHRDSLRKGSSQFECEEGLPEESICWKKNLFCQTCMKKFKKKKYLRRHGLKFHGGAIG